MRKEIEVHNNPKFKPKNDNFWPFLTCAETLKQIGCECATLFMKAIRKTHKISEIQNFLPALTLLKWRNVKSSQKMVTENCLVRAPHLLHFLAIARKFHTSKYRCELLYGTQGSYWFIKNRFFHIKLTRIPSLNRRTLKYSRIWPETIDAKLTGQDVTV